MNYLVVEEGAYIRSRHGVDLEAVRFSSTVTDSGETHTGQTRTYQNTYTTPKVLGQMMTYNDARFIVFWCSGQTVNDPPAANMLKVGKHTGPLGPADHGDETIGYVVVESTADLLGGLIGRE